MEEFNSALEALTRAVAAGRGGQQDQPRNALARSDEPPQDGGLWGQIKTAWANPNQQALLSFGGGAQNGNETGILGKLVAPIPGMDPTGRRSAQGVPEAIANTAHTLSPNGLWDMGKGIYDAANRLTTPVDDNKGYQEQGDSYVPYNGAKKVIDAFGVASALPLAGAPAALMREGSSAGIFGGKLAKTADLPALERAQAAKAAGVPREQIWSDHGWFEGVDGKWRHELDDSLAGVQTTHGNGPLYDQFWHDPLQAAYPDTSKIGLFRKNEPDAPWAGIHWPPVKGVRKEAIIANSAFDQTSPILHELQHSVQDREGFAQGGAGFIDRDTYNRLAGETEARTVQKRMDMTAEERRARPPWLDYDVPEDQQIVRFGGNAPQMSFPAQRVNGYIVRKKGDDYLLHRDLGRVDPAAPESHPGQLGRPIGSAELDSASQSYVDYLNVNERQRGKGAATALYNGIEADKGAALSPSSVLTDDGHAFWSKRNPEAVADYAKSISGNWRPKSELREEIPVLRQKLEHEEGMGRSDSSYAQFIRDRIEINERATGETLFSNPTAAAPLAGVHDYSDFDAQLAALSQLVGQNRNALSR